MLPIGWCRVKTSDNNSSGNSAWAFWSFDMYKLIWLGSTEERVLESFFLMTSFRSSTISQSFIAMRTASPGGCWIQIRSGNCWAYTGVDNDWLCCSDLGIISGSCVVFALAAVVATIVTTTASWLVRSQLEIQNQCTQQ